MSQDDHTKNAASATALAFHYQVLIGLEKCFALKDGQSIWFERDGDVSLRGGNTSQTAQIEVKDYDSPLTDHHENLWKTLKNWLASEFDHRQYGALVLHTTQPFGKRTKLKDWNSKTVDERLGILKSIFATRTAKELNSTTPAEIVKLQKAVMADELLLRERLSKVVLFTEAENNEGLTSSIISNFCGIPKLNKKKYLEGLVGFVYGKAEQSSWDISYNSFRAKCEELTALFCKKEFTMPPFLGVTASPEEINENKDKLFVKKIMDIEHGTVIPEAIGNWLELINSLSIELDEYPIYREKTNKYQQQLINKFNHKYSSAQINKSDSRLLYNDIIGENPLPMENHNPPMEYKNGLIHDAMDDEQRNLKWKVDNE